MTTKTLIEISKEDLKNILCSHFKVQRLNAKLSINITKADRPSEVDEIKIIFEAESKSINIPM